MLVQHFGATQRLAFSRARRLRTAPSPSRLLGPHPRLPACSKSLRLQCRSAAEPQLSMGAARVKKQPPPPALPPAQQLHSIDLRGSSVVAANGAVILDELRPGVWAEQVLGDMLVLGAETGAPGSSVDVALGRLRCARWLCAARNKMWWMTPEWGATAAQLPPETQFLLMELEGEGGYAIMLPLIDDNVFRGTLRAPSKGTREHIQGVAYLRMESGDEAVLGQRWPYALLVAAGADPFELVNAAVAQAASLSGGAKPLSTKRLPPSLDVFGWCSWDAFYSSVSAQGLVDAVQSLIAGGVPPRLVIIDDGWQTTDLDSEFKGWPEPAARLMNVGSGDESEGDLSSARAPYIEGETEMISAVVRDIPAGSATGVLLQEVIAADDANLDSVDLHSMAQQHGTRGRGTTTTGKSAATGRRRRRRHRPFIINVTGTVVQYVWGLIVGGFSALVLLFYQWVVDPAADGTWPVRFFAYLAKGPLRSQMLQFYADQTNFTRRLVDVRANSKFHAPDSTAEDVNSARPANLAAVVKDLKERLAVQHIYCWHALPAYWSGVSADAPGMQRYNPRIVYARPPPGLREIEPSMQWNPAVLGGLGAVSDPDGLFNDMHSYLAESGVTGVKVDGQAGVGMAGSMLGGGPALAARYHAALEDSVARHFPANDAINCMCHSTENMYRWRDTAVARASDDFYPTDTASHSPHLAACAYNALFISPLALPDWDMFHSRHTAAHMHAAARAVSGGPVYVSDAPGAHEFDLLRQLVLSDGSILRAALAGRPTRDSLFRDVLRDGVSLMKVWNCNASTGVVGVFNLQGSSWDRTSRRFAIHEAAPPELSVTVKVTDVEPYAAAVRERAQRLAGGEAGAAPASGSQAGSISAGSSDTTAPHGNGHSNGNGHAAASDGVSGYESDVSSEGGSAASAQGMSRPAAAATSCDEWAMYVNTTGQLHRVAGSGGVQVTVPPAQAAVVTVAPICRHFGVDFAPLGLSNMLNGGGAVGEMRVQADWGDLAPADAVASTSDSDTDVYADMVPGELSAARERGAVQQPALPRFMMAVRGRGTLLALCSLRPAACRVEGYSVPFTWDEGKLDVDVPQVGSRTEQQVVVEFR